MEVDKVEPAAGCRSRAAICGECTLFSDAGTTTTIAMRYFVEVGPCRLWRKGRSLDLLPHGNPPVSHGFAGKKQPTASGASL